MEVKITLENFDEEVLKSDIPVIVDFYADWCGPCKMLAPELEAVANDLDGKVKIGKVNVDEQGELANAFGINAIPALIVFKNGQEAAKHVGYCKRDKILSLLA
jgi:thioredoxin 1